VRGVDGSVILAVQPGKVVGITDGGEGNGRGIQGEALRMWRAISDAARPRSERDARTRALPDDAAAFDAATVAKLAADSRHGSVTPAAWPKAPA